MNSKKKEKRENPDKNGDRRETRGAGEEGQYLSAERAEDADGRRTLVRV